MKHFLLFFVCLMLISSGSLYSQDRLNVKSKQLYSTYPEDSPAQLLNQNTLPTAQSIVSNDLRGRHPDSSLVQCADNFTVPGGMQWTIDSIAFTGTYSVATNMDSIVVAIYSDVAGAPGTTPIMVRTTRPVLGITTGTNMAVKFSSPLVVPAGNYWVSIYAVYNTASTLAQGRWNWSTSTTATGLNCHIRDYTGLFGIPPFPWTPTTTLVPGELSHLFSLFGTSGTPGGSTPNASLLLPTPGVNTNYVAIPHQASMVGFGNNVTIEAWVNVGSFSTANTVLNKGGILFDYQLGIGNTGIPFFRAQGTIATGTGVVVTAGTWTHLAVTYDGTTARFYKDGVLGATVPLAMTLGASTNEMRIGRGNADPGSGNIDEVRLWSVARSGSDILADMCKKWPGTFTNTTGLKAVWHLDSTLVDSVSGYNGTQMGTGGFGLPATCLITSVNQIGNQIPDRFVLSQNYPNPFNPTTTIRFEIPTQGLVSLKVYDIAGREVGNLINEVKPAGVYLVGFNGNNLASGTYFYRLEVGNFVQVRKMILLK